MRDDTIGIRARSILNAATVGSPLAADDERFARALLGKHPERDEKVGCGLAYIYVDDSDFGTRCFFVRRTDGSSIDFSYRTCVYGHRPDPVATAARRALAPFMKSFIETNFIRGMKDPVSGKSILRPDAQVDHVWPNTFVNLLDEFKASRGSIKTANPPGGGATFESPEDERAWLEFHDSKANLRIVTSSTNARLGAREPS